jgi:hypothetical protein
VPVRSPSLSVVESAKLSGENTGFLAVAAVPVETTAVLSPLTGFLAAEAAVVPMESLVLEPRERGWTATGTADDPENRDDVSLRNRQRAEEALDASALERAEAQDRAAAVAEMAALRQQHAQALEALAFEIADRDHTTYKMNELRNKYAQALDRVSQLEHFQRGAEVIQVRS